MNPGREASKNESSVYVYARVTMPIIFFYATTLALASYTTFKINQRCETKSRHSNKFSSSAN